MQDLDYGILNNKKISVVSDSGKTEIRNPFFNKKLEIDEIEDVDLNILSRNYKRILVLCLMGNNPVNPILYNSKLSLEQLSQEKNNLVLQSASIKF